ncbi:MAG TPA: polysaccharide deacetylase family protein [Herpetosiphonaceae bacterium]|nr:polysaccharide deacetylase family protein [Herpetosiphonaceae bacterium]
MTIIRRAAAIIVLLALAACGEPARGSVQPPAPGGAGATATASPLAAHEQPSRLELGEGSVTNLSGRLAGGSSARYLVRGRAGQTMVIDLDSPEEGMLFSIHAFSGATQLTPIVENTRRWSGQWFVAGDYLITISAPAAAAEYALALSTLDIGPLHPPHPTPPLPTAAPDPTAPPAPNKVLYLTFDDGPDPRNTPGLLELLARYNARATFFVLGHYAQAHPDLIQAEAAAGHTVANHTFTHPSLSGISREAFMNEVLGTKEVISGVGANCLRPPYGATDANTRAYAAEIGYEVIMWDIDTHDWANPGADEIGRRLLGNARDGAIVLMHDGGGDRAQTIAALEAALPALAEQGYRFEALCQ